MDSLIAAPKSKMMPMRPSGVPGSVWAVLVGGASIAIGILWDISWHRTIGRDTFWTPAHLAIYAGGIVAGLTCGWLALRLTFASGKVVEAERAATGDRKSVV